MSKIKSILKDYKLLLNNVPALVTVAFVLGTCLMNLAAGKIILNVANVAITGGFFLSWLPFLCMDTVTRRFGARASIMLNILSAVFNVLTVLFLALVAAIPTKDPYTEFNYVFGSVWFIVLGSTVAFVVSGIVNSLLNAAIGKLFKKNPNGGLAFFLRSWVSTFIGQAIDNFLFLWIVYVIFAPKYWGMSIPVLTCIGTGILGGLFELLVEVIFSPLGLCIVKSWDKENVGQQYIDAHAKVAEGTEEATDEEPKAE